MTGDAPLTVGFVGLGTMGAPMAGHLAAKYPTCVWNRTPAKAELLRAQGAQVAESLRELAERCEVICLCVNRSADVIDVVESLAPYLTPGSLIIDHSTIAPDVAKSLGRELAEQKLGFIDAPITGGSMGAQRGTLTIFCGGEEALVERARPYLSAYGARIERVGPIGSGQMMKMANQIAVGGALMALCESLAFAAKAGLDLKQTRSLLAGGAAGSWAFENYGPKILARDWSPGFSVENQRKDFGYSFEAAQAIDAAVPGTRLVDHWLAQLVEAGHGADTTARLFEVLLAARFDPE